MKWTLFLLLMMVSSFAHGQVKNKLPDGTLQIGNGVPVSKLELGYLSGASSNIQTQLDAKEGSLPVGGTTSKYLRGDKTWQDLNKTAVGLPNVDNTSDSAKPVSTATQTALDGKVSLTGAESIAGRKTFTTAVVVNSTAESSKPCPVMSNAQMLALTGGTLGNGYCVYNSDKKAPFFYDSTSSNWKLVSGSGRDSSNILLNYNFSDGITGWTSLGVGPSIATAPITSGASYAPEYGEINREVTCSGVATGVGGFCAFDQARPTTSRVQGMVSAYIFVPDSTTKISFHRSIDGNADLSDEASFYTNDATKKNNVNVPATGQWIYFSYPTVLGATSTGVAVRMYVTSSQVFKMVMGKVFVGAADLKQKLDVLGPWTTGTCSTNWVTNTTVICKYRQSAQNLDIQYDVNFTGLPTPAATVLKLGLPTGYTMTGAESIGTFSGNSVLGATYYPGLMPFFDTTTTFGINFNTYNASPSTATQNNFQPSVPVAIINGNFIHINVTVQVQQLAGSTSFYSTTQNSPLKAGHAYVSTKQTCDADSLQGTGASVLRSRYPELFAAIGTTWGNGTTNGPGSTPDAGCPHATNCFNIPYFSGTTWRFIGPSGSGTDPDAASRVAILAGGLSGNNVGTYQSDSLGSHNHSANGNVTPFGAYGVVNGSGGFAAAGNYNVGLTSSTGGSETRMRNSGVLGCVRTKDAAIVGRFADHVTASGSQGVDIQRVYFGAGANCASFCTSGTCNICNRVGTKITSIEVVSSPGQYKANGIDGKKYICTGTGYSVSGGTTMVHNIDGSTSSMARFNSHVGSTVADSALTTFDCVGTP